MEVCRLCLDLLSTDNFTSLEGDCRDLVQFLVPELDIEICSTPVICTKCMFNIDVLYTFKKKCFQTEAELIDNTKTDLGVENNFESNKEASFKIEKTKGRTCRTCFDNIECDIFIALKSAEPDTYFNSLLSSCLPDIDLELTKDPVMCEKCSLCLQKLYQFRSVCLDVEEKLRKYNDTHGTSSRNQINLHNVLHLDHLDMKTEPAVTKPEGESKVEIRSEDVGKKAEVQIKHEVDEEVQLKQEEVSIKPDEETDDNDSYLNADLGNTTGLLIPTKNLCEPIGNTEHPSSIKCVACNKEFSHRSCFIEHLKIHKLKKFNCNICLEQCKSRAQFQIHLRAHTGETRYLCKMCGISFANKYKLKVHFRIHTGEKPFKCDLCGKQFRIRAGLKNHLKTHIEKKPIRCDVCNKMFVDKTRLKMHFKIHIDGNRFKCGMCDELFSDKAHLTLHLRSHAAKDSIRCDTCHRLFKNATGLKRHLRSHTEEKLFRCHMCSKSFRLSSGLRAHVQTHAREKSFRCYICDKLFTLQHFLDIHLTSHTKENSLKCDSCDSHFRDSSALEEHLRIHRGEKPYKCDLCHKQFKGPSSLKYHRKTHKLWT